MLEVEHHRTGLGLGLSEVELTFTVETRDGDHGRAVLEHLRRAGYRAMPAP